MRRYWVALFAMIVLSPLGLLADGTAWGEWGGEDLQATLGYVPQGIEKAGEWWQAIFPDYSVPFLGQGQLAQQSGYILSAIIGSAVIYGITLLLAKVIGRSNKEIRGH